MKKTKLLNWQLFAALGLLFQTIGAAIAPTVTKADEIDYPQTVNIEYDLNGLYHVQGTYSNGTPTSMGALPLFAVYNGVRQPVFCIEPGVPIPNTVTPGYEKNPLPAMSEKAKLVSVLWKYAGTDADTQMVAQKMVWKEVNGFSVTRLTRSNKTNVSIGTIENKINHIIEDYQKKPSFDRTTVKAALGKSVTLTDNNNLNLSAFDHVTKNTANVDYHVNGNQLTITPNVNSKESGVLTLQKNADTGTPIVYKKAGLQTLMAGAIDKPNSYTIKLNVETKGTLKIIKKDKESGKRVPDTVFHLDFGGTLPDKDVKTGEDGTATIDGIPHGTKVTITEKQVPEPYTIDTTPLTATIQAGETIEVTSKNYREKGMIFLNKSGVETGTKPWNELYTLAGNIYDIRKDSSEGNIVQTLITDKNGHAKTPKEVTKGLELGTYFVTERKASDGFVNMFTPVKVELKYANQTVAVVSDNAKGSNQEITGQTTLTKEDKETGKETQSKATFKNATYTLYYGKDVGNHKAGEAVKWSDNFKPELVKGAKVSKDTVSLTIDDENQVAVKHLAIGEYYWEESQAPVGYAIDETQYPISIQKINDAKENAVITQDVTAKEQVIRLNFDFFKFANSAAKTASTGFNDLRFKVTPLEGTKKITGTKDEVVTARHEATELDGYGKFENLPYGDYRLEEIEAPKGFEKINPLLIHSDFKENKEDYAKSEYVFTITEKGQEEPIKVVTIPYAELTGNAFSISLNRLMLYDLPKEKNSLTSLAAWRNGDKELTTLEDTELTDKLSYKLNQTKEDWFVVSKAVDVEATKAEQEKDAKAEPVVIEETTATLGNKEKSGSWELTHKLTAEQALDKTIVLYNYVYKDEAAYNAAKKPIAADANLNNPAQTVKTAIKRTVTIKTKAHTKEGQQMFTYGDTVDMYDDVTITHDVLDGAKEAFETTLYALLPNGTTKEIWKSEKIDYVVDDETFTKTVLAEKVDTGKYPKGTIFTFTETNYDKDGKVNGKHNEDLKEEEQTLTPKERPETPNKPENPKQPSTSKAPNTGKMPQTGETRSSLLIILGIGLLLAAIVGGVYRLKKRG